MYIIEYVSQGKSDRIFVWRAVESDQPYRLSHHFEKNIKDFKIRYVEKKTV